MRAYHLAQSSTTVTCPGTGTWHGSPFKNLSPPVVYTAKGLGSVLLLNFREELMRALHNRLKCDVG